MILQERAKVCGLEGTIRKRNLGGLEASRGVYVSLSRSLSLALSVCYPISLCLSVFLSIFPTQDPKKRQGKDKKAQPRKKCFVAKVKLVVVKGKTITEKQALGT